MAETRNDQSRDHEREAWNAALASGDRREITRVQDAILHNVAAHIVADDDYIRRTR